MLHRTVHHRGRNLELGDETGERVSALENRAGQAVLAEVDRRGPVGKHAVDILCLGKYEDDAKGYGRYQVRMRCESPLVGRSERPAKGHGIPECWKEGYGRYQDEAGLRQTPDGSREYDRSERANERTMSTLKEDLEAFDVCGMHVAVDSRSGAGDVDALPEI
eukprot:2478194-Rhodomonas_salina.1